MAASLPVRPLGEQGLHASAQGLGCMSLTNAFKDEDFPSEQELITVIQKALTSGVSLLNTADLYGMCRTLSSASKLIKADCRPEMTLPCCRSIHESCSDRYDKTCSAARMRCSCCWLILMIL